MMNTTQTNTNNIIQLVQELAEEISKLENEKKDLKEVNLELENEKKDLKDEIVKLRETLLGKRTEEEEVERGGFLGGRRIVMKVDERRENEGELISVDGDKAVLQLISIIEELNIEYKGDLTDKWLELKCGLVLEMYNEGRAKKGLLTTAGNKNMSESYISMVKMLGWDKYGKSKTRYQLKTLGKPVRDIRDVLEKFLSTF